MDIFWCFESMVWCFSFFFGGGGGSGWCADLSVKYRFYPRRWASKASNLWWTNWLQLSLASQLKRGIVSDCLHLKMWVKYAWYASYNYSYVCLFAIGKVGSASFAQQAEPPGSLFQLGYWYHILIRGHCFILFAFDHTTHRVGFGWVVPWSWWC